MSRLARLARGYSMNNDVTYEQCYKTSNWLDIFLYYLWENVENGPHDKYRDWSVGRLEDVFGIVMSFVVVVWLLNLLEQLVPVLAAELLAAKLLPRVKLWERCLDNPLMFHIQDLVINVWPANQIHNCKNILFSSSNHTFLLRKGFPYWQDIVPWLMRGSQGCWPQSWPQALTWALASCYPVYK